MARPRPLSPVSQPEIQPKTLSATQDQPKSSIELIDEKIEELNPSAEFIEVYIDREMETRAGYETLEVVKLADFRLTNVVNDWGAGSYLFRFRQINPSRAMGQIRHYIGGVRRVKVTAAGRPENARELADREEKTQAKQVLEELSRLGYQIISPGGRLAGVQQQQQPTGDAGSLVSMVTAMMQSQSNMNSLLMSKFIDLAGGSSSSGSGRSIASELRDMVGVMKELGLAGGVTATGSGVSQDEDEEDDEHKPEGLAERALTRLGPRLIDLVADMAEGKPVQQQAESDAAAGGSGGEERQNTMKIEQKDLKGSALIAEVKKTLEAVSGALAELASKGADAADGTEKISEALYQAGLLNSVANALDWVPDEIIVSQIVKASPALKKHRKWIEAVVGAFRSQVEEARKS